MWSCDLSLRPLAAVGLACLTLTPGCPAPGPALGRGPEATVRAFEEARRAGRAGARWVVEGADLRRLAPVGSHAAPTVGVARPPRLVRRELRWGAAGEAAVVSTPAHGARVRLLQLAARQAASPEDAVALLAEAIRARDYAAILALVPAAEATRWTEARLAAVLSDGRWARWDAVARALQAAVTVASPPDVPGTAQARPRSGAFTVFLVREDGHWKIADVRPHQAILGGE